jgi:glutamine amidotransferase-like uncharacterized protein
MKAAQYFNNTDNIQGAPIVAQYLSENELAVKIVYDNYIKGQVVLWVPHSDIYSKTMLSDEQVKLIVTTSYLKKKGLI